MQKMGNCAKKGAMKMRVLWLPKSHHRPTNAWLEAVQGLQHNAGGYGVGRLHGHGDWVSGCLGNWTSTGVD